MSGEQHEGGRAWSGDGWQSSELAQKQAAKRSRRAFPPGSGCQVERCKQPLAEPYHKVRGGGDAGGLRRPVQGLDHRNPVQPRSPAWPPLPLPLRQKYHVRPMGARVQAAASGPLLAAAPPLPLPACGPCARRCTSRGPAPHPLALLHNLWALPCPPVQAAAALLPPPPLPPPI